MPITHAQFSQQAAYVASRASSWAGEVLTPPEQLQEPMRDYSVRKFTAMLRETADIIECCHNEPS
jgi:NADPH-dependent ferric siderophore reductase